MGIMNSLTFGSVNTATYKTYISGVKTYKIAERDYEQIEIPGRNGYLLQDNNRFKPVVIEYDAFCVEDIQTNVRGLLNALLGQKGIVKLSDTYDVNHYRMGYYGGGVDPNVYMMRTARFTLQFVCQPERWLELTPITITESTNFTNPTLFDAKPIITVTMASGSSSGNLYVSRYVSGVRKDQWKITFSGIGNDIIMNCETMDFYDSNGNNLNSNVVILPTITSGDINMEFPMFAGSSLSRVFTVDGGWDSAIASITVNPRWWEL